jgi:hypothetical protein
VFSHLKNESVFSFLEERKGDRDERRKEERKENFRLFNMNTIGAHYMFISYKFTYY